MPDSYSFFNPALYTFEYTRDFYKLCPYTTGFFEPLETFSAVQQLIKTMLMSFLIAVFSILESLIVMLKSILIMGIAACCLSDDLFMREFRATVFVLICLIVEPVVATTVMLASIVSIFTRAGATLLSYESKPFQSDLLDFLPPRSIDKREMPNFNPSFISILYTFEGIRKFYTLCPYTTGFFEPLETFSAVQQLIKTMLISFLMSVFFILECLIGMLKGILTMGIAACCLSDDLFMIGFEVTVGQLTGLIVLPVVAATVMLASIVSIFTRAGATLLSYQGKPFQSDLLDLLPCNPQPAGSP